MSKGYKISYLDSLESESIHIMREVYAEFEKPVMLYSIGKDSSCLLRLAQKAFYPGRIPFPLLHVDTSYKFTQMIDFRDKIPQKENLRNHATGSFIIIDELSNATAAAGIIWYPSSKLPRPEENSKGS